MGTGSAPPAAGALLERTAELGAIADGVRDASAGEGGLLVIEGPAGIGKSALLDAARTAAEIAGMAVLCARGGELERGFGFGVARQLFESAVGDAFATHELFAGRARLAAPLLGMELDDEDTARPPSRDPGEAGFAAVHGLYWLAAGFAERRPLALVVDDAHWVDAASLRFLIYLARRLEGTPLMLAVAQRPPAADDRLLRELAAGTGATVLTPEPLSATASGELVAALAPGTDDEACRACHGATGGNPFFLRELAHALSEDGGRGAVDRLLRSSPARVTHYVGARIAALPPPARELARAAAVLGQDARLRHAAALARLDVGAAGGPADALRAAGILSPQPGLAFVHPIVRTAAYEEIPAGARAAMHAHAATLLADEGSSNERVATHLAACEPRGDEWTCERLATAGREALARGAPEAGARYLRRALEEPPPTELRAELLLELGGAEASVYEPEPAVDHLREAFDAATEPNSRLRAALLLAGMQTQDSRGADGVHLIMRVLEETGADEDLATSIEAHLVNLARFQASTRPLARATAERLRERVDAGEDNPAVLATVAAEMAMVGERADRVADLAARALEQDHDPRAAMGDYSFMVAVRSLIAAEGFELATSVLDEGIAGASKRGAVFEHGYLMAFRSEVAYHRGAVSDAEADARFAYTLAIETEWPTGLAASVAFLISALIERGELEEAGEIVEQAGLATPAADLPDLYTVHLLLCARGRLRIEAGALDDGLADLLECGRRQTALGEPNPSLIAWRSAAAPALRRTGDPVEARRLCAEELELARAFGAPRAIGVALCGLGVEEGGAKGLALLREAVEVLAESPARLEHARALAELGELLRGEGDRSGARDVLRQSLELAHHCGAVALEQRVLAALRAAGARPRRALRSGPDALTPSERRVAELAAHGMSNREIAESLFVTVRTVEFHLHHSYRKLEIESRGELAGALAPTSAPGRSRAPS